MSWGIVQEFMVAHCYLVENNNQLTIRKSNGSEQANLSNYIFQRANVVNRNQDFVTSLKRKRIVRYNARACHQKHTIWKRAFSGEIVN